MTLSAVRWAAAMLLAGLTLAGCESYSTPGARADFSALGLSPAEKAALSDSSVQKLLEKKPLVQFPAAIAVAHVQGGTYNSYSYRRYAGDNPRSAYTVITTNEVETEDDFKTIAALPKVKGVATIKRILLDQTLNSDLELRNAAAKLHADLLLCYTFDTAFYSQNAAAPLSLISLGVFPTEIKKVRSTASALLMDVNNGYIYAVVEATAANEQLTNAWASAEAADQGRLKSEREAFADLIKQFVAEWPNVLKNNDKTAAAR